MILKIEELSMNAWPSLQTNFYDGWVLRFSEGYTKRANSINPIFSSTLNIDEKIEYCEHLYGAKKLPIVYKMTDTCHPKNLDTILESKGYIKIDDTSVQVLDLATYKACDFEGVDIEDDFSLNWLDSFADCSNTRDQSKIRIMTKMLQNIIGEKICVKINFEHKTVACGFGVIEDSYIGIFDIIVKQEFRGKGYGSEIMHALLKEAQKKKLLRAYLQVVKGNFVAENLYNKLGFKENYRYWYRIKQS